MPLRLALAATVPKAGNTPEENEDSFAIGPESPPTRFALSDGATESYDSRVFAQLLCQLWLTRRLPVVPLRSSQRAYDARLKGIQLSWSDAAALERGSFATLLAGAVVGSTLRAVVIGDSLLVYLPPMSSGAEVRTIPYSTAAEFEQSPMLLSTLRTKIRGFGLGYLRTCIHEIALHPGGMLVCMTDAVGAWYLAATIEQRQMLIDGIRSEEQFREFVDGERARRAMRNDDSTILMFDVVEADGAPPG